MTGPTSPPSRLVRWWPWIRSFLARTPPPKRVSYVGTYTENRTRVTFTPTDNAPRREDQS